MVRLSYAVAALLGGCGLIDSNVADFDLSLPPKSYAVETDSWGLTPQATTVLDTPCSSDPSICTAASSMACADDQCSASCSAATSTCDLAIPVHLYTTVNLRMEKPELESIDAQAFVSVEIDSFEYEVAENTLNIETPPLSLYVAPANQTAPGNAVMIGQLDPIPAGATVPLTDVPLTAEGRAELVRAMKDFRTPFNVLVGTDIVLGTGDEIPTGRMSATLVIRAHAGL
jgi:hypothetical protein